MGLKTEGEQVLSPTEEQLIQFVKDTLPAGKMANGEMPNDQLIVKMLRENEGRITDRLIAAYLDRQEEARIAELCRPIRAEEAFLGKPRQPEKLDVWSWIESKPTHAKAALCFLISITKGARESHRNAFGPIRARHRSFCDRLQDTIDRIKQVLARPIPGWGYSDWCNAPAPTRFERCEAERQFRGTYKFHWIFNPPK